jgi:hypothetical protein
MRGFLIFRGAAENEKPEIHGTDMPIRYSDPTKQLYSGGGIHSWLLDKMSALFLKLNGFGKQSIIKNSF